MGLAHRLHDGLSAQGHTVLTPPGNHSAIVAFEHGRDIDMVRRSLDDARIRLSFKEGGAQLRAGVALFNTAEEIDLLLDVTSGWS